MSTRMAAAGVLTLGVLAATGITRRANSAR
jgi:hypothetical protein